ncbi:MAG: class I SAM-dependent methyltransferase [Candidatus Rokubacteria bacterium]|nr:class I SAM-dependent methyltransferase [Candidatus Rokubacteria bacterium]
MSRVRGPLESPERERNGHNVEHIVRYWEQPQIWGEHLNSLDHVRVPETIGMIPAAARTIVEVGCGNGRLLNRTPATSRRVGVDLSATALKQVRGHAIQASCDRMPLATGAADLVLCADVLEHLPDDAMRATAEEMKRVTRRYLLIGVPFEERFEAGRVRCASCGHVYNQFGHLRRFTSASLDRLFRGYRPVATRFVGGPRKYYSRSLLWIQQRLGRTYWGDARGVVCPSCGSTDSRAPKRRLDQKVIAKLGYLANEAVDRLMPVRWKPAHEIVRLYERSRRI